MEFYEDWVCTHCGTSHDELWMDNVGDVCSGCGLNNLDYVCGHYDEMTDEELAYYDTAWVETADIDVNNILEEIA